MVWIGSGKLGLPDNAIVAFALDADMAHVARETMLEIGAQQQGRTAGPLCPDPATGPLKVSEAASVDHPGLLGPGDVDIMPGTQGMRDWPRSTATARAGAYPERKSSPRSPS